uniref:Uncharacterized protein n=1 Tax=Anguilla anguilla TaxID=7936 RepID=A0A0E9W283_ANGAN
MPKIWLDGLLFTENCLVDVKL